MARRESSMRCSEIGQVSAIDIITFSYPHAKTFCLWKTFCEDEGVRAVVQCLTQLKSVFKVDLLDNKITALGCEFVSTLIHPKSNCNIEILKLDHNEFGSAGVIALSEGLAICKTLKNLSLTYCNIDAKGARSLFEILIYSQSKLTAIFNCHIIRSTGRALPKRKPFEKRGSRIGAPRRLSEQEPKDDISR